VEEREKSYSENYRSEVRTWEGTQDFMVRLGIEFLELELNSNSIYLQISR
jgi:hypothetical protein